MMGKQETRCGTKAMPGGRPAGGAPVSRPVSALVPGLLPGLALSLALVLGLGCPAPGAETMDWSDVTAANKDSWTGDTNVSESPKGNFFNTGNASNNTLTVRDANSAGGAIPSQITGDIYGGYSNSGVGTVPAINAAATAIENNTVILRTPTGTPGTLGDVNVYGGYKHNTPSTSNKTTSIRNNTVIIENGVKLGKGVVAGGMQGHNAGTLEEISSNSVFIYGGAMKAVFGALVDLDNGDDDVLTADRNKVVVDLRQGGNLSIIPGSGTGAGNIYGANTRRGDITNNSVAFYVNDSSTITQNAGSIFGGRSGFYKGEVSGNSVLIDASARTKATAAFGDIFGGSSGSGSVAGTPVEEVYNSAFNNTVRILGNSAAPVQVTSVTGGRAILGPAHGNTVQLADVAVTGYIAGGHASLRPEHQNIDDTDQGSADNNSVTILRGSVGGAIYGGRVETAAGTSASNNTVSITDAAVGSVYGGSSTAGATTNNAVFISGYGMRFNAAAELVGGSNGITGNSLTTTRAVNMSLATIRNFEQYTYNMTSYEMDRTIYSVANPVDFTGADHTLNFDATVGPPLHEGQVMVLIDNTANGDLLSEDKFVKNIRDGFLYNYDSYFGMRGDELIFEITGREEDERNVTFGQSQLAGMQMANAASDLARGIHRLYTIRCAAECYDGAGYAPCPDECERGPVAFMTTQGGSYNWDTGSDSRLNLDYVATLAGLGWKNGGLLLAGFFETGMGSYDAKVRGRKIVDGEDVSYVGGGGLVRYESGRAYGEAGFHAGQVDTDFESSKFGTKAAPLDVEYSTKAFYFGLDALAGYKFEVDCSTIDLSARYSWNRVEGDDFTANDARFSQSAADSHRIRAGAEWSYSKNAFHPYVGAFYEYEADGETSHEVYGEKIKNASVDGSTGIGRLGLRFGGGEQRLSLDIGLEGHVGERRGIGGTAMLGYAF